MDKEERALYEAYQALKNNFFWKYFIKEVARKKDYYTSRLAEADNWEEICRIQGGLSVCRQLLLVAESIGKGDS